MYRYYSSRTEELLGMPVGGHSIPKVYLKVWFVGCFFYGAIVIITWIGGMLTLDCFIASVLGAIKGIILGGCVSKSSTRRLSDRKSNSVWEFYLIIIIPMLAYFLFPIWLPRISWLYFISMEFITMGLAGYSVYRRFEVTTNHLVKGGMVVIVWREWLAPLPTTHRICPKCGATIPHDAEICAICGLSKESQE